ncbi:MAG: sporulation protein YtfJ [Clostridia bacterium]|nr:sporulation protein YtfJ [Clostridia bacterium]
MSENKISDIIKTSLGNIREIVDANTIIGDPINTANGTVILPVSKVTVGMATGGFDYTSKKAEAPKAPHFGGGGGTGLSVIPVAFMVIHTDGTVELLNIQSAGEAGNDTVNALLTLAKKSPDIIAKFKEIFGKKDSKKDDSVNNATAE